MTKRYIPRNHLNWLQIVLLVCLSVAWCGAACAKELTETLVFEGKVHYSIVWGVRNAYEGQMKTVFVKDSQAVKKGEVLGQYVISEYTRGLLRQKISSAVLQQKQMTLNEARTKLRGLKRDQSSLLQLYDEGMTSKTAVDAAMEAIEQQQDLVDFLKEDVKHEEQRLKREKEKISEELGGVSLRSGEIPRMIDLVSPIDGNIVWGIYGKLKLNKNAVCFKVADITRTVVRAKVFVEDYPKLAKGMKATVTAKGQPGKEFPAVLNWLPLTPTDKGFEALSYYLVHFRMNNSERLLREGYRVTVKLEPQTVAGGPKKSVK